MRMKLFLVLCLTAGALAEPSDSVTISGIVTDFSNQPIDSVVVRVKNQEFSNLYETFTDESGAYSLRVAKGSYYCLYAIKPSEYGKTALEYWAWNLPAYQDLKINPQYQRMEIYGLNAFEPQLGSDKTVMVYFRPMSLTKGLKFQKNQQNKNEKIDTIAIAPQWLTTDELTIKINGKNAPIVSVTKIAEYAKGVYMFGYLAQAKRTVQTSDSARGYDIITVRIDSKENGDKGKGEYFLSTPSFQ